MGSHAGVVVVVMVVVVVSGSAVDSFSSVPPSSSAGGVSSVVPSGSSAIKIFNCSAFCGMLEIKCCVIISMLIIVEKSQQSYDTQGTLDDIGSECTIRRFTTIYRRLVSRHL